MSAFNQRIQPIRDLIKAKGLDAFVLRRNPNLAWAIAGRAHVPTTIDMACFDLIITQDSATAVTNVVEAPRLIAEELPTEVSVNAIKWSEGRDAQLPTGSKVGSDQPGADRIDLGVEVEIIRASLIASDVERFTTICTDAAIALGNAMKQVESSDREIDVAGLITHSLWQADLEIAFLGVAGEDRVHKFRHPLPTDAVVGNRCAGQDRAGCCGDGFCACQGFGQGGRACGCLRWVHWQPHPFALFENRVLSGARWRESDASRRRVGGVWLCHGAPQGG